MRNIEDFNHFMWLKVVGRIDGLCISGAGVASIPAETYIKYQRRMKILKENGVEYPDWKNAKRVLKGEVDHDSTK